MSTARPPHAPLRPAPFIEVVQAVRKAWYDGRPIVPIVGAGLSADAGFPVLTSVVRYFGKLKQYIAVRAYLPPPEQPPDPLATLAGQYDEAPWRFVADYGWPDRLQLNQDLLTYLTSSTDRPAAGTPSEAVERSVREGLNSVLRHLNPHGWDRYQRLRTAVVGSLLPDGSPAYGALSPEYALGGQRPLIDGMDLRPDGGSRPQTDADSQAVRRALEAIRRKVAERFDRYWTDSVPFDLVGDWKKLIQYFTRSQADYADALFATFGAGRRPSQGHRYLAFLIKLLGVRTVFTFNFDDLIEQAFEGEGIRPEVFAMEEGSGLPHHTLIRDTVAVIKLHGGNHSLLLDERLDRPLGDEYKERFDRIVRVRDRPLLLVVGCSGNDYRLRDLVLHVLRRAEQERRLGQPVTGPDVVWLHYEPAAPLFLREFVESEPERAGDRAAAVHARGTNNPGSSLLHLHSWLTRRCPGGRSPYLAHVQRPVPLWADRPARPFDDLGNRNFYVCSTLESTGTSSPTRSASRTVLGLARYWSRIGYQTVWVDLESVHTLAGVVGAIIDQCRQFDASLPPAVLPLDDVGDAAESARGRAVELVTRALRRTRYFVVLDGLETYAWPATTHHGLTHMYHHRAVPRLENLCLFLQKLVGQELGESRVCLAVDGSKSRHDAESEASTADDTQHHNGTLVAEVDLLAWVGRLRAVAEPVQPDPLAGDAPYFDTCLSVPNPSDTFPVVGVSDSGGAGLRVVMQEALKSDGPAVASLVLFYLSCFRRTRTLVALDTLLRPVLGSRAAVDRVLSALPDDCTPWLGVTVLEGGGYWFDRRVRDYIYENNTIYTSTRYMHKCFLPDAVPANIGVAVFQLFLTAVVHQQIARAYYTQVFVQSQDTFVFMEYTYHRLSSVRSLTKLIGLADHVNTLSNDHRRGFATGIHRCGLLYRTAVPSAALCGALDATEFDSDVPGVVRRLLEFDPDEYGTELTPNLCGAEQDWTAVLKGMQEEFRRRHRRELRSLERTWARSESTVRCQLPAEQLLNWCDILLEDDFEYRVDRVVTGYDVVTGATADSRVTRFAPKYRQVAPRQEHDLDPTRVIQAIRTFLRDFRAKSLIERSDYAACVRMRVDQLTAEGVRAVKNRDALAYESIAQTAGGLELDPEHCRVTHCHYLLDIAVCLIKQAQEATPSVAGLGHAIKGSRGLLRIIDKQLRCLEEKSGPGSGVVTVDATVRVASDGATQRAGDASDEVPHQAGDAHEARLRLHHLLIECDLLRASVFSHDGFDAPNDPYNPDDARREVKAGLDRVRDQDPRTGRPPRSVIVDPTADGALYLQYRSIFNMQSGRVSWMGCPDGQREEAFEAAFRKFDLARGGLGESNPLVAALSELYVVEACLARARYLVGPHRGTEPDVNATPLHAAVAKFETARVALQRAREHLLRGRRNVIWWKLFFQLVAQYHADRLLLGYVRLCEQAGTLGQPRAGSGSHDSLAHLLRERLTQFLVRLRRAYQSVRSAFDLYLPVQPGHAGLEWPLRAWSQITLSGYAVGRLGLWAHPESPYHGASDDPPDARKCLVHYLRALNTSALLLPASPVKDRFELFEATVLVNEPAPVRPPGHPGSLSARERWDLLLGLASGMR